jgi:dTDP-4-dehydrorhamnose reductase
VVCDLLDAPRTLEVIRACRPDVVIHAQALSDVDQCEREPALADALNVTTIRHVLRAVEGTDTLVVYVSTDYVFDGTKGAPYDERDAPRPTSVYGRSKLAGERVALGYPRALVVRPSTLFGPGRTSFCEHVVSRVQAGQPVEAFADQVTSPTYTEDLAGGMGELIAALHRMWETAPSRLYHIVNAGSCSRVTFARRAAALVGGRPGLIQSISMAAQHRPARRPPCSALVSVYLDRVIGRVLRPWDDALEAYLRDRRWLN